MSKLHTQLVRSLMLCTGLALGATPALAANVSTDFSWPGTLEFEFDGDCSNNPGPWITLGPGTFTAKPVKVVVRFDGGGDHDQDVVKYATFSLELKEAIQLPKQPSRDGVTGNPYISVLIGDKTVFGPVRCNKL